MNLTPIPKPQVLDPDRPLRHTHEPMGGGDHRSDVEVLEQALHDSCAYAQQLWDRLDATRHYLVESLTDQPPASAAPTGRDDEDGWQNWMTTFAAITSELCGPHGDSGYGTWLASHEAHEHRDRTVPAPALGAPPTQGATERDDTTAHSVSTIRHDERGTSKVRAVLVLALVVRTLTRRQLAATPQK
jgi:hypothetical protein